MLKPALAVLLALTLAGPARAAAPPDAMTLLGKVGDSYRALTTYHFEGTMSIHVAGPAEQTVDIPVVLAGDRAGRAHMEARNPQMGALFVSDGTSATTYLFSLNQYTRKPAEKPPAGDGMPLPPQNSPLTRYFDLQHGIRSAAVTGDEGVSVGGQTHDCWVVRCEMATPQAIAADSTARALATFWVDKARGLVLRDSTTVVMHNPGTGAALTMDQVTRFDLARVNEPLADSLFAFEPPAGALLVSTFGPRETPSELVGKPAPPFTLTGVKGSTVSLAAYKGKVVMLDFWATWCKPCRIEMPHVQKLYQEFKPKGLVVFGVNLAEEPAAVRKFLSENPYTFPILLDRRGETSKDYGAEAIPTLVIIGRDGKVSSYFQGVRPEDVLREALAKAGMN
jgi:peroxiredoxin/outer membrane lipoprotein-sorting protein